MTYCYVEPKPPSSFRINLPRSRKMRTKTSKAQLSGRDQQVDFPDNGPLCNGLDSQAEFDAFFALEQNLLQHHGQLNRGVHSETLLALNPRPNYLDWMWL